MSPFARPLAWLVRLYRIVLSPALPPRCRYLPTCSEYALDALERHGALKGGWLAPSPFLPLPPLGRVGLRPRAALPTLAVTGICPTNAT